MSMATQLQKAFLKLLRIGGTDGELRSPDGTLKAEFKGAFVNWGTEDEVLRKDYDKEAQKFYIEPVSPEPEKHDYMTLIGRRWTVLDVHPRIISGIYICHVCVIKK